MTDRYYSISDEVFAKFPAYTRGVVLAYDVHNGDSSAELVALLRAAEASLRERLILEGLTAEPRIAAWRDAYRAAGIKPSEFRASIEAMSRRALRSQELPSINALVDIGNVISLRHLAPVGGHAIDRLQGDIMLRPARGTETFVAFGSEVVEHPEAGEIVFVEGDTVLTRRWTWRQANHTLTLPETTAIEFNVDGLTPITPAEVAGICDEVVELVQRFCGGHCRYELLTRQNPRMNLTL